MKRKRNRDWVEVAMNAAAVAMIAASGLLVALMFAVHQSIA